MRRKGMNLGRWTAAGLAVFFLAGAGLTASAESIEVVTEEWEWCTETDGTGLYFDILREVFNPEGYTLDITHVPYSRSTHLVKSKEADVVVGPYADEVSGVVYPEWHFDNDAVSVVFVPGENSWSGEESLRGKRAAFIRGYAYDEYFDVSFRPERVNRRKNGYDMLRHGRVDYFIDAIMEIEGYQDDHPDYWEEAGFDSAHAKWLPLYFCFADTSKGRKLAELYDRRFEELLESGRIKEMFEEWEFDSYSFGDY